MILKPVCPVTTFKVVKQKNSLNKLQVISLAMSISRDKQSCQHLHLAIRGISYNNQEDVQNYIHHNREKAFIIREISKLLKSQYMERFADFRELSAKSGRVGSSG